MNLFFDFDGPIIDVSDRYYRAYLNSLNELQPNKNLILTKEAFWELKRNRITDFEIGLLSGLGLSDAKNSSESRKELSFKKEFLSLDKLFPDIGKTFEALKANKIPFYIITLRRKSQLVSGIKQFKLEKFFKEEDLFCIPDDYKITNDIHEKYILLVNAINKLELAANNCWLIGDTETDIFTVRLARLEKVIAITRGIRSKEQLELLNPNLTIDNMDQLLIAVKKNLSSSAHS